MQPLSVENNEKVWTQLLYQYISENHHKDLITCMICFIGGLAKSSSFWCTGEKKVSQITGRGSLVGFEYKHTGSKTIVNSQPNNLKDFLKKSNSCHITIVAIVFHFTWIVVINCWLGMVRIFPWQNKLQPHLQKLTAAYNKNNKVEGKPDPFLRHQKPSSVNHVQDNYSSPEA